MATGTALIGRAREIAAIEGAFDIVRFGVIVGMVGMGKSRLVEEIAARWRGSVLSYDLAAGHLTNVRMRLRGEDLGVVHVADEGALLELCASLANSEQLLVVFDDADPLAARISELGRTIIAATPNARVLATARSPLPPAGQAQVFHLGALGEADAAVLFDHHARLAKPDFVLAAERIHVDALTHHVDGLPIAIELLASQVGTTRLAELLGRPTLNEVGDAQEGPLRRPEHASIGAVCAGIWSTIGSSEASTMNALSVFQGPFDATAAAAVLDVPAQWALNAVARHAVLETRALGSAVYYRVPRLLKHSPPEASWSERDRARARLCGYLAQVAAERLAVARGPEDVDLVNWSAFHLWDLVSADFASSEGPEAAARAVLALLPGALWLGHRSLLEMELGLADKLDVPPPLRADLAIARVEVFAAGADIAGAEVSAERLLSGGAELTPRRRCRALLATAEACLGRAERERAAAPCTKALGAAREAGDVWLFAAASAAALAVQEDAPAMPAEEEYLEASTLARRVGHRVAEGRVLLTWGAALTKHFEPARGLEKLAEARNVFVEIGHRYRLVDACTAMASCSRALGRASEAASRLREALGVTAQNLTPIGAWEPSFGYGAWEVELHARLRAELDRCGSVPDTASPAPARARTTPVVRRPEPPAPKARPAAPTTDATCAPPLDAQEEPGDVVAGRYRVERFLRRSGNGDVYLAHDLERGRAVEIKLLQSPVEARERRLTPDARAEVLARLQREASARLTIRGDHVEQAIALDEDPVRGPVLVSEWFEGESLLELTRRTGPLPFAELHPLIAELWLGLATMHSAGVVHRDVRGSNVFIGRRDGSSRVELRGLDFCWFLDDGDTAPNLQTAPGGLEFLPPEQLGRTRTADPRADVYAASTVVFMAVTGQLPYVARNVLAMIEMKTKAEARSLTEALQRPADSRLEVFVSRGLARNPEVRFPSACEALEAWRSLAPP